MFVLIDYMTTRQKTFTNPLVKVSTIIPQTPYLYTTKKLTVTLKLVLACKQAQIK